MKKYLTAALLLCLFAANARPRPNIVYIMSDDHAWQAVSAYGHPIGKIAATPNIDRLAGEGMRFDNVFCTNAICGPSRAAIVTGKYSHVNGYLKNEKGGDFNGNQPTVQSILRDNGYTTAIIGKWHLGSTPTGFDRSVVMKGQGLYFNCPFIVDGKQNIKAGPGEHSTAAVMRLTLDWLENGRDKNKPFLLMCHFKAPHRGWQPDPKYAGMFDDVTFPVPDNFNDDFSGQGREFLRENTMSIERNLTPDDLKYRPEGMTDEQYAGYYKRGLFSNEELWTIDPSMSPEDLKMWKLQKYLRDYLATVHGVDVQVGRLLDWLEKEGLADNTIVIYTSDQGFFLGEHGFFDKRLMYEESCRMPFLMRYPGKIPAGSANGHIISNIDFAPTLLDYAGVNIPSDIQGRSFRPTIEQENPKWRESFYYHYYEYPVYHTLQPHYGIRTDRYKLIHFYYNVDQWQLFDLKNDPSEMNNLYYNPQYAGVVEELTRQLKTLQREYGMNMTLDQMREVTDRDFAKTKKQ